MRVLVIEDDARIADDVGSALSAAGFVVEISHDGEDGWFRGDSEIFDAVVLDLGLPILDGLTVLRRWRAERREMPVIILTARDAWREKVDGIDAGADDYLTKPFRREELVARVRALTRRAAGQGGAIFRLGPVEINTNRMTVAVAERAIALTPLEYRLLAYFAHHADKVLSQTQLSEHIYPDSIENDSNTIEVLVARLRKKLGVNLIETRRGQGYIAHSRPAL